MTRLWSWLGRLRTRLGRGLTGWLAAGVLEMVSHTATRGDMAILVIAHNLEHIFSVCTRVLVLRRGSLVADVKVGETTPEDIVGYITGAR